MTVIDIRNIFSDRNIELVAIDPAYIYYAEEKNEEGRRDLYLLEYNRRTKKERLVMNYTFDDPSFAAHIYSFDKTIVLVVENGSNSLWLIELEKKTGGELNRRKIVCTGRFKECLALDADHILIYMSPDEENAEIFVLSLPDEKMVTEGIKALPYGMMSVGVKGSSKDQVFRFTGKRWAARLNRCENEGERAVYRFAFTEWKTHNGMAEDALNMNRLTTALEKMFFAINPETRLRTEPIEFERKHTFL